MNPLNEYRRFRKRTLMPLDAVVCTVLSVVAGAGLYLRDWACRKEMKIRKDLGEGKVQRVLGPDGSTSGPK